MVVFLNVYLILLVVLPISLAKYFPLDDIKVCMSHKLDRTCSGYAYKKIKYLLDYYAPINNEIEERYKEIASLKQLIQNVTKNILELNEKLKTKNVIDSKLKSSNETIVKESNKPNQIVDSLKSQIAEKNAKILVLQSQITSCQNNDTIKGIEINNLKTKFNEFKAHKYLPNGCDSKGKYTGGHVIQLLHSWPHLVYCDSEVAGHGWTVIQRRNKGNENFYLNWYNYKWGFGDKFDEFFIGLEFLHQMIKSQRYELYINLFDQDMNNRYARYDNFVIGSDAEKYKLKSLGKYTGNAGDAMRSSKGQYFSTLDRDNDKWDLSCAVMLKGAWWYNKCSKSNLNGKRLDCKLKNGGVFNKIGCAYWRTWHGGSYSMRNIQMMIRPYDYHSENN